MAKKDKKPTNKRKFSIYVDGDVMAKVAQKAESLDRSVNWVVENTLKVHVK